MEQSTTVSLHNAAHSPESIIYCHLVHIGLTLGFVMGKRKKWKLPSVSHFATMRGKSRLRQKSVEGLCASTLLGVLHTRTWLLDAQLVYLLERTQAGPDPPPRAQSLCSFSRTSSADGGNEDTIDLQSTSLDTRHNFTGQGKLCFRCRTYIATYPSCDVQGHFALLNIFY